MYINHSYIIWSISCLVYLQMNQSLIRKEDIAECDFIFATPAMAAKLLNFRNIVGDRMPTLNNGNYRDVSVTVLDFIRTLFVKF